MLFKLNDNQRNVVLGFLYRTSNINLIKHIHVNVIDNECLTFPLILMEAQ